MDERERVAVEMHNLYESWAAEYGWKTQDACRVDYADLPEKNKRVMEKIADWHLAELRRARAQAFEEAEEAILHRAPNASVYEAFRALAARERGTPK